MFHVKHGGFFLSRSAGTGGRCLSGGPEGTSVLRLVRGARARPCGRRPHRGRHRLDQ